MRVERNKKARRTTGPIDLSSPLLAGPGAGNKTVDLGRAGGSGRVAGREDIVRVRPPGTLVLHGRSLPNRPLVVEHLVVAPRGLVVVGPSFGQVLHGGYNHPAPTWRARESAARPNIALAVGTARAGDRRPALVRETLRRCYALRSWLAAGPWDGVPVLAAVCGCPAARASAQPWLMIDGLWLGTADQLPDWLVSEEFLDLPTRVELYRSLVEQMPIA
jgi:hypothetical protein